MEPHKLTAFERVMTGMALLLAALFVISLLTLVCGCSNTGVRVVASSASYTNICDINWDEYKIPALSVYLGPKATVWINKDYTRITDIEVSGTVTNSTAALAIYDSNEEKTLQMHIHFDPLSTNGITHADSDAPS